MLAGQIRVRGERLYRVRARDLRGLLREPMARTGKSSTAGSFCGASTMMDHYNHVHVAIRPRQHRRGWREHRRRLRPAVRRSTTTSASTCRPRTPSPPATCPSPSPERSADGPRCRRAGRRPVAIRPTLSPVTTSDELLRKILAVARPMLMKAEGSELPARLSFPGQVTLTEDEYRLASQVLHEINGK